MGKNLVGKNLVGKNLVGIVELPTKKRTVCPPKNGVILSKNGAGLSFLKREQRTQNATPIAADGYQMVRAAGKNQNQ